MTFALGAKRLLHSIHDGGREAHESAECFEMRHSHSKLIDLWSWRRAAGQKMTEPMRRCFRRTWHTNPSCVGLRSLDLVVAEPRASIREKIGRTHINEARLSDLGWDWCCVLTRIDAETSLCEGRSHILTKGLVAAQIVAASTKRERTTS